MDQGSMLFYLSKLQKCRTLLSHLYFPNLCLQAVKIFYDFTVFVISRIHGQQSFFYIFIYLKVAHLTGQMTLTNLGLVMYSLSLRDWSLFMQRWGGEKKKGGQGLEGGGAKCFYKEVQGGQQFDRKVYFKRGPLAKMDKAVKQKSTNNICETVMLNCTILC